MKKTAWLFLAVACFFVPAAMTGCGGGSEPVVIEAPAEATEEEAAMEGMDEEDYDAAMDAEGEE